MVTYDREFLVPYLKNLCALYYAQQKLNTEYNNTQQQIAQYTGDLPRQYYVEKAAIVRDDVACSEGEASRSLGKASIIISAFGILYSLVNGIVWSFWLSVFVIIGSIFLVKYGNNKFEEEQRILAYENAQEAKRVKAENDRIQQENYNRQKLRQQYTSMANAISEEYQEVQRMIDRAYDANIIPGNYRDMYTVVYLYDFFSKGRSCDMDAALNLYVLEQIKAKLDIIIQNQSEMLLNQELMLANQERALEERREHHKQLEHKIDRMNCELEEANQYRQVIQSDLESLEFFARDSYIRRLCS